MIAINSTFHEAVKAKMAAPFAWGTNDCALMVADIYHEVTGLDLAEGIRGTYSTEYEAMRKIVELGGWDAILTQRGFTQIDNLNFVQRGDVVISDNALGIWIGRNALFAGGIIRDRNQLTAAYRRN
jgi:hypothetical protein